jgi:translocation and assembly module TamB
LSAFSQPPLPPSKDLRQKQGSIGAKLKRVIGWTVAALLVIVLILTVGIAVLLRNNVAHQKILQFAERQATESLGARVQVQNFAIHPSNLSLDIYGITLHGPSPYSDPPLLQVEHIQLGVRIVSILHRKWYLNDIRVDHPVARVLVDKEGKDNLPKTKSTGGKSTSVFDLAVRHVILNRGEIYYNNRKSVLNADLQDLSFQSSFDTGERRYSGNMAYRNGQIQFSNFNPMVHDLDAPFDATPTTFLLKNALLTSGLSKFMLNARVDDYSNPRVQANYDAVIDAGEFRRIMKNPTLPLGVIRAAGTMHYQSAPQREMLDMLTLDGNLSSRALQVQLPTFHGTISQIGARYSLANRNIEVRDMRARLLGGEFSGTLAMRDITGASRSQLHAGVRGLSLAELKRLMPSASLKQVALGGSVSAVADATWGKTFDDLAAHTDATIQASVAPAATSTANAKPVPINGVIHANYAARTKQIALTDSYLRTPQTSLNLNGTVSNRSSLQVRLQSNELHELETFADVFRTPTPGQQSQPLGIYGAATFSGAVRGATNAPQITGQLAATNLRVRGSAIRLLRTNVDASPSDLRLQNGEVQPANRGRVNFNLRAGLRDWSFTDTSALEIALKASQLDVAELAKAAGSQAPVSGTLSADVAIRGSQLNPVGHGTINLTEAKLSNEPIQSLSLDFQGTGNELQGKLALHIPAGAAQGAFTYLPKQQGYDAQLRATGLRLDKVQTLKARNIQLTGVLNVNASGRGTLKDPQLTAKLEIPKLQVQNQTISEITLQGDVANHLAKIALDSQAINTSLHGRGTVQLTGDYYAEAKLDSQIIPLQPLVAIYAPSQAANLTGQTEIHGTLRGPLKKRSQVEAHLIIPTLQVNYKKTAQFGAASPIRIDYTNGAINLQRATIRGTDTNLQIQGMIPTNKAAPASLLLLGTVNLQLVQMFAPDITSSGEMRFNINSYGATTDPNVHGKIELVNTSFKTVEMPIGLQNGNGVLTLTKDRLEVTDFHGTVGGGAVTASGSVAYRPSLRFNVGLEGKGIRMLYPEGVRESLDTRLALTGSLDAAELSGQVNIGQLSFTPDFDLASFLGQFSTGTAPAPAQGFTQNLQLNVAVRSTSGVNLVSRTLSLQATANLQVRGTAAQPVILGRVNLTSGDLIFMGNRYVLQGGTIDFVNRAQTLPVVNVAVDTTIQQYNIHLRLEGPVDHLRTNYASDPALPPSDIINLLAFGQTTEAAGANPLPGNLGAQSLVASAVSNQVTSRLEKITGISHLSVSPTLGNTTSQQGYATVSVQERVTGNLFVTFSTDVAATQTQVIEVQYNLSPRVSVTTTRNQNGGFAFQTNIRRTW